MNNGGKPVKEAGIENMAHNETSALKIRNIPNNVVLTSDQWAMVKAYAICLKLIPNFNGIQINVTSRKVG